MNLGEREGLVARIRQIRRVAAAAESPTAPAAPAAADQGATRIDALETRLAHLEQLVQGFQDSVHREAERHAKLIAELQAQVEPTAMSAALSKNARDRGV